jgi:uncharacterized protein YkwD
VIISTVGVAAASGVKGDFNDDGRVTAVDARMVLMVSAEFKTATEMEIIASDMDGNGKLTAVDARIILHSVAGFEDSVPDDKEIELQMTAIIEEEILRLVNEERIRVGANPLVKNDILTAAAMVRAGENAQTLSHTRPNGKPFSDVLKNEFTYEYIHSGENLAFVNTGPHSNTDYSVAFTEESLKALAKKYYNMLSDDDPHYRQMVGNQFTETGVGIAFFKDESKKTIRVVCCHLFGTPKV